MSYTQDLVIYDFTVSPSPAFLNDLCLPNLQIFRKDTNICFVCELTETYNMLINTVTMWCSSLLQQMMYRYHTQTEHSLGATYFSIRQFNNITAFILLIFPTSLYLVHLFSLSLYNGLFSFFINRAKSLQNIFIFYPITKAVFFYQSYESLFQKRHSVKINNSISIIIDYNLVIVSMCLSLLL